VLIAEVGNGDYVVLISSSTGAFDLGSRAYWNRGGTRRLTLRRREHAGRMGECQHVAAAHPPRWERCRASGHRQNPVRTLQRFDPATRTRVSCRPRNKRQDHCVVRHHQPSTSTFRQLRPVGHLLGPRSESSLSGIEKFVVSRTGGAAGCWLHDAAPHEYDAPQIPIPVRLDGLRHEFLEPTQDASDWCSVRTRKEGRAWLPSSHSKHWKITAG
jgi:hypothetical protein